jgi:signal transduction histidine kinase
MPASRQTKRRKNPPAADSHGLSAEQDRAIVEAVERDQRRVAQALHDTICQSLTGIHLLASVTARRFAVECPPMAAEVMTLSDELNQAVDEVRDLVRVLLPTEIEAGRLRFALQALATEISEHVPCEFECQEPLDPIDAYIGSQLYPIAQVAVDRALQVPGVSRTLIGLREQDDTIELTVRATSGEGNAHEAPAPRQLLGWELMQHRARAIGATLSTDFNDGDAMIVSCRVPAGLARRGRSGAR